MSRAPSYPLTPSLTLANDAPSRQVALARALREKILNGSLKAGDRLPSTRLLATDLSLSRNTVVQALERLAAEGLIEGRHGSGTFVSEHAHKLPRSNILRSASKRARSLLPPPRREMTQPLTPGVPALDTFPKALWAKLSAKWAKALSYSELDYGDPAGISAVRAAIAHYITATRGVVCKGEQVIITSGSQGAIATAAFLVSDPGDGVIIENPGYPAVRNTLALAGLRALPAPVDAFGLSIDCTDVDTDARIALAAPSHQYPLGVTMSMERRMALLAWARRKDGWIIEDDYDGEYRYDGHPLPALASLDDHGAYVLYVGTLSKVLSPSVRIGFLVVPDNLIEAATRIRGALDRGVPTIVQAITADFIADGHLGLHIRKTQALYAERRDAMVAAFEAFDLCPTGSAAGLHMTFTPENLRDDRILAERLRSAGLGGNALSDYFPCQDTVRQGIVFGFANATGTCSAKGAAVVARYLSRR